MTENWKNTPGKSSPQSNPSAVWICELPFAWLGSYTPTMGPDRILVPSSYMWGVGKSIWCWSTRPEMDSEEKLLWSPAVGIFQHKMKEYQVLNTLYNALLYKIFNWVHLSSHQLLLCPVNRMPFCPVWHPTSYVINSSKLPVIFDCLFLPIALIGAEASDFNSRDGTSMWTPSLLALRF